MQIKQLLLVSLSAAALAACSPAYNWRDYNSPDGAFRVLFPAKPATHTRDIDLGGIRVAMTMTAAEVEGTTFAVGTAVAPDAAMAQATLPAMRQALLRNIGASEEAKPGAALLAVDATGKGKGALRLVGRFVAKGERVYQVIVVGKPGAMPPEQTEQFLSSFAPQ
ncbi:hypothetical protein [Massilia yuzhufengensis]|uniref:Transmembrane protein n=1 Tax=Massilia yuzhufengensis TaxID=1164594 RepID=A0A1I1KSL0_9BURK|nr:hypothetical protein [Massilia yuzhufengensis]SFC60430.1 hypothetical protein SAMN05216204_1085 [Massilia yuzhufengensis]